MQKNSIRIIVKGLCVGSTMLVPGVSGGSMAMLLGIYDKLVSSVSSFMKHKRESCVFLGLFTIGGLSGILIFARPMAFLIDTYKMPMMYFFIGAVLGGIPTIYEKAGISGVTLKSTLYIVLGVVPVTALAMLPEDLFTKVQGMSGFLMLCVAGFVAAVALVLPGISVSYMFLVLGLYDTIMESISCFNIIVLAPLVTGLFLGIILTTHILETAMMRFPQVSYMIILGFVLASAAEIFPGIPSGSDIITCPVMAVSGFLAMTRLAAFE